jgi:chorismate mutase-like protein
MFGITESPEPAMSKKLEEIRRQIDALDDKIHDVLMERAELIVGIAEEKRKNNMQFVQPAREAVMIRRLLTRHHGALPQAAIVRIWRELVGAVSLLQTGLKVSVCVDNGNIAPWDMAKNYFGSVVPMQKASNALLAVSTVRENESSFAVLPWPSDQEQNPWWVHLFFQDEKMRIVCALPYGSEEGVSRDVNDRALVISKIDFTASGSDHSFIVIEAEHSVSRARIVEAMEALKLKPLSLNTKAQPGGNTLHLVEVDDYFTDDDKRLDQIRKRFEGYYMRCAVLGGYPVPPVYKKT